jgi:hypothetical protein
MLVPIGDLDVDIAQISANAISENDFQIIVFAHVVNGGAFLFADAAAHKGNRVLVDAAASIPDARSFAGGLHPPYGDLPPMPRIFFERFPALYYFILFIK